MSGYGDDPGFATWLTANGYTLPASAPTPAVLRLRGSNYIDGLYGDQFLGSPADGILQEREWPRTGVSGVGDNVVPDKVIEAAYSAAYAEAVEPGLLIATVNPGQRVVRERVEGAVDVSYAAPSGDALADATVLLTDVHGLLKRFLRSRFAASAMVV